MSVVVVEPPLPLVSVPDAKIWAPVLGADDDARVAALLQAGQAAIEPPNGWLGRALGMQVLEARFDDFGDLCLDLPFPPVRALIAVTYRDAAGTDHAMDLGAIGVRGLGTASGSIAFAGCPPVARGPEAVRVRYRAGYTADDPEALPIRHAILLAAVQLRALSTQDLALRSRQTEGVGSRTWTVSDAAYQLVQRSMTDLLAPLRIFR